MITILMPSKIKSKCIKDILEEYKKRINRYINIKIQFYPEQKKDKGNYKQALREEAQKIISLCKGKYMICCDINGKTLSTGDFFKLINSRILNANNIVFVIGGKWGLDRSIIDMADMRLSLSPLTLNQGIAAIVLIEQIYRAISIMNNLPY